MSAAVMPEFITGAAKPHGGNDSDRLPEVREDFRRLIIVERPQNT
jgi:hypothetical protein